MVHQPLREEIWLRPSMRTACRCTPEDDRFYELFVDLGPAMPRAPVGAISDCYLDALLATSAPEWLRARLQFEKARRNARDQARLSGRLARILRRLAWRMDVLR